MNRQHIPFTPIKEHFSEYEVENGQILKVKVVLTDIVVETKEDGKKVSYLEFKDAAVVTTDIKIDTSNSEYADTSAVTEKDEVKPLKFKIINEPVNIYETERFLIFIVTMVTKISMTNKKDRTDNPILRFTSDKQISTLDKSSMRTMPSPGLEK